MKRIIIIAAALLFGAATFAQPLNNTKVDGYRGIWFTLGQESEYGFKYSGGLGTYTVKHIPMAIYAPEAEKTFFVYGGTTEMNERHLLCMIGCYDHKTGMVQKPTVVFDKEKVNDPHDNPSLQIDSDGYLWVFVSGRNTRRMGHIYRSEKPYDISSFVKVRTTVMTYPQPWYIEGEGFFFFFTKYTGNRRLYYATSPDGVNWSEDYALAHIRKEGDKESGQYQVSNRFGKKVATAFNRHPNGKEYKRSNIYYMQTQDMGKTWTTADGATLEVPVTDLHNPALVFDAEALNKNVYIKDLNFDEDGNPVILYLMSGGHKPGPANSPYSWNVVHWTGKEWKHHHITNSFHNYDSGSIWVEGREWTVIAPTDAGPQKWCTGGEVVMWKSRNAGKSWKRIAVLTSDSRYNHGYVRRPAVWCDPFYGFWADGNPERITQSTLYFTDSEGNVMMLPYDMKEEWAKPEPYKTLPITRNNQ